MENNRTSSLLTKNHLGPVADGERSAPTDYLDAVKAFARLTYESVYVINYETMTFEYVSDNPLFLCGYSTAEVLSMGYDFYFKHVPAPDLALLEIINEAGFDFFAALPGDDKMQYSITYDFHLLTREGKQTLINHKLTPLVLTGDKRMWKSMCIVSLSHHKTAGNVCIYKQGSDDLWELDTRSKVWVKSVKPVLTGREIEVLRLHAQGLSIQEIADRLFVVEDTVKYYRRRIFERLGVKTMGEALSYAVGRRIV